MAGTMCGPEYLVLSAFSSRVDSGSELGIIGADLSPFKLPGEPYVCSRAPLS